MFLGHTTDLQSGQAKSIEVLENKKVLINDNGTYKIGSNICPHQNSRIISGVQTELRCQYHGWSWHMDGTAKDSGASSMCNEQRLHIKPAYEYKGLLFEQELDFSMLEGLTFENLRLDEYRVDTVNADPKISMDIFLDVDHIPIVHNGVYDLLGIEGRADVSWNYADWGSMQTVSNESGVVIARWIAIYPFTMIEWQAGALFITRSFTDTKMAVWKYYDTSNTPENYKLNSDMWENAFSQDKAQAEQMARFPSANLEEAKLHYRTWLKNNGFIT
jgi:phenylpropionate dioxygenase-like ring-hydroxylating dioxygenase large terminal subunit